MGDLLGNLIFVVIAILAWTVKVAVERKEAKEATQKRRERMRPRGGPAVDEDTGEVDVVYGRRKIPDELTPEPPEVRSTSSVPAASAAGPTGATSHDALTMGGLPSKVRAADVGAASTATPSTDVRPTAAEAWSRLGVSSLALRRDAARAGVLWSEVLATPRAVAGPHRSPVVKRMQGRRR